MRLYRSSHAAALSVLLHLVTMVSADRVFHSSSLDVCQSNSSITASLFNIWFTPGNQTLTVKVVGESSVTGNVSFSVKAAAYGYTFLRETLDPCKLGLTTLCPLSEVEIAFDETFANISQSIIGELPGVAFGIPDLDAVVTVNMYQSDNPKLSLGCVKVRVSNGKTVNQAGVKWTSAVIAIIGLIASALVSSLGHANTAAHVTLYASALFGYFQTMAIIGLCAVPLPPIVLSWTQDFIWSLGIIRVGFLQTMATWYQLATGGTPTTILKTLSSKSVQVAKRNLDGNSGLLEQAHALSRRATVATTSSGEYIVTGMQRVAFLTNMEPTNLFLTCVIFYCIFVIFTLLVITIFKALFNMAIRARWIESQSARFQSFNDHFRVTVKGVIFRLILIGAAPMLTMSLWEFTQNDSPAEIVLGVLFFFGITGALALAAFHVIRVAKRSDHLHQTPAFLLYADATTMKKWGFLYIQFRASAYYYILPTLAYILLKAFFVGLAQKSGTTQAIALVLIEAAALIGVSVIRPFMDKVANTMHIAICVINFLNAIFLLIFTDIFNGPGLLIGVIGVVFFFMNVIFALVLLIIVLVAATFSIIRKDPETRYQPMADNRGSFIKSQTTLTTELDMLAATARGDSRGFGSDGSFDDHEKALHPPAPVSPVSRLSTPRVSTTSDEHGIRR